MPSVGLRVGASPTVATGLGVARVRVEVWPFDSRTRKLAVIRKPCSLVTLATARSGAIAGLFRNLMATAALGVPSSGTKKPVDAFGRPSGKAWIPTSDNVAVAR